MNQGDAASTAGMFTLLLAWNVIGNLIGMVLVLIVKPKGRNRFGKPGAPCNPIQSITACMTQYSSAAGRSSRSEFWWFFLAALVISLLLDGLDSALKVRIFHYGGLGLFLPLICAQVRRLHDINRSGWWVLLNVTLLPIVLWVLYAWPPTKDDEQIANVF
jgi:uncharacterized membrane protein YhaH (DUF805 family)